jgi:hypothetical protein
MQKLMFVSVEHRLARTFTDKHFWLKTDFHHQLDSSKQGNVDSSWPPR